jgi:hypothetical protein
MRTGFSRDLQTACLRFPHHAHRTGGADVREVETGAGQFSQRDIARDHDIFRSRRNARKAEFGRDQPFVHTPALRQVQIFAVVHDRHVEGARVFHGASHDEAVHHRLSVVGDGDTTGATQIADFRQFFAFRLFCDGADRIEVGVTRCLRAFEHEFGDGLIVVHGIGVGHRADGRESTRDGRSRSGLDRLFILEPRLAEMHVEIHEPRKH